MATKKKAATPATAPKKTAAAKKAPAKKTAAPKKAAAKKAAPEKKAPAAKIVDELVREVKDELWESTLEPAVETVAKRVSFWKRVFRKA